MDDNAQIKIVAIVMIGILEAIALLKGIDGTLFALTIAAISGIAGYHIGKYYFSPRDKNQNLYSYKNKY